MKNDAHNRDWKKYPTIEHPRFGHKITTGSMIAKLTNPDDSLHLHMDTTWTCCQNALRRTESLNMETLSKTRLDTPKAYKQQWPDEDDHWEMSNPLQIGPPDLYDDNHDPYADFDEDWFQGRYRCD